MLFYTFAENLRHMKVQTAFRFDKDLLELIKEKAAAQKRSLNNYIEYLLYKEVGDIPNEETKKAIYEAHNDINLTPIDDLDKFLEEL
ncbi:MAG TPA: hypothetical protein DEO36_04535 [Flavobacteriaceae bacterium]|jgi:hypothetical protein|nr:hypothetical protein [Flavobacteriaceae bacterium]